MSGLSTCVITQYKAGYIDRRTLTQHHICYKEISILHDIKSATNIYILIVLLREASLHLQSVSALYDDVTSTNMLSFGAGLIHM